MADVQQSKIKSTLLRWALESKSKEISRYDFIVIHVLIHCRINHHILLRLQQVSGLGKGDQRLVPSYRSCLTVLTIWILTNWEEKVLHPGLWIRFLASLDMEAAYTKTNLKSMSINIMRGSKWQSRGLLGLGEVWWFTKIYTYRHKHIYTHTQA